MTSTCLKRPFWSSARAVLLTHFLAVGVAPSTALAVCDPAWVLVAGPGYDTPGYANTALPLDLNHDGILDLAVCDGNVTVLLGNGTGGIGDGTFTLGASYGTGSGAGSMTSGDFDGDGIVDLVVTNASFGSIGILFGNGANGIGDGTFAPTVSRVVTGNPRKIAAADFNTDGILDLAYADGGTGHVRVLIGAGSNGFGNGTFAEGAVLSIAAVALATGDLDTNGTMDIVCTDGALGNAVVILGHGDGAFDPPVTYIAGLDANSIAIVDLDGDGASDLIVGNASFGGVSVLRGSNSGGHGDGTFDMPAVSGAGIVNAVGIVSGDFNGDNVSDVIATTTDDLYFYRGRGDGTLATPIPIREGNTWFVREPSGLAAADVNGDGKLDLVLVNGGANDFVYALPGYCREQQIGPDPELKAIQDVPDDQGGRVALVWKRSSYDGLDGVAVTGYRVWRRVHLALDASNLATGRRATRTRNLGAAMGSRVGYWEAIVTLPAQQLEGYAYVAATTRDSLPGSNPFTQFFVSAITSDARVFYDSNVDSGYSVDNLAPNVPQPFVGVYGPLGATLHWAQNREADLAGYRVHRGNSANFEPSASTLVSAQPDTGYQDFNGTFSSYYKLSAVDIHGNESSFALVSPDLATPALVSLQSAEVDPGRVRLIWYVGSGQTATIYRRSEIAGWTVLGEMAPDGENRIVYEDLGLAAGRYAYRLGLKAGGTETSAGEVWVEVPELDLSVSVTPNPTTGSTLNVHLSLPDARAASLELLDVAGRLIESRGGGSLGPGRHTVTLRPGQRLAPGVYLVRVRHADEERLARVVVIR